MKTLKESILSRSNHTGEGFKAQRREMIEKWLKEYNIKNYTINTDLTIDVRGNVDLSYKGIEELPDYIQFGIVKGSFSCSDNKLTTLKGSPRVVQEYFSCSFNELTSLEGAPESIGGDFYCYHNQLTSLEGAPKVLKYSFDCSFNKLTSLKGAPEKVGRTFFCSNNSVQFTRDDVKEVCNVKGSINC